MANRVLGLDLGVSSIGWALIDLKEDREYIAGMGSRIVPLSVEDDKEFTKGVAISKNQNRTQRRTQRKGYDRFQQRRALLVEALKKRQMLPDESLARIPALRLWGLRARAAEERIALPELGRVLLHLNQKRGYKHARTDESDDKQRDYVRAISDRYRMLQERRQTIGQYFLSCLQADERYRVKDQVFPRRAYTDEFDSIMEVQRRFYPEILTPESIDELRNRIIYYQRGLKSCKHLVSLCEFEKRAYRDSKGKTVYDGPRVAPRTSPLFQVCKIWESINNLTLKNRQGETYVISPEQKAALFRHMDCHEKLTLTDLYKILGLSRADGYWGGKAIGKGLSGNTTKMQLLKALGDAADEKLLRFDLILADAPADRETGEIRRIVDPAYEQEPLYRLWHVLYSVRDKEELASVLQRKFGITDAETIDKLSRIDFVKPGFGNKSAKAIRKILPYLQEGMQYDKACLAAGFRHSDSLTAEENAARPLQERLKPIEKNALRQPVVEKILNQMVNLVNALLEEHGTIDEIRVELARELKQSREERNETFSRISRQERENEKIALRVAEYETPSRSRIQKYRLWEEAEHHCFYCGQLVGIQEFLSGTDVEVEHIVPRSLLFDDSFSNKVCACRRCNHEKGNRTAYDYMRGKPEAEFQEYLKRVEDYYKRKKIGKTKRDRLLTPQSEIPADFIERQLRESQYIARKSREILQTVCRNVTTTSGGVTAFIRHVWGWDDILHDLNRDRFRSVGLIEERTIDRGGQKHRVERIKGWTKREDHRHHAIDALVVACTRPAYIKRLNDLNAARDAGSSETADREQDPRRRSLEGWFADQPHFSVREVTEAVSRILVSFKAGKKVATPGKQISYVGGERKELQRVLVPRGALSEESVYGRIRTIEREKPLKYLFEHSALILKPYIRKMVEERIREHGGDVRKALASLRKNPLYLDAARTVPLKYATCCKCEYVLKYPIESLKAKDVPAIVDGKVRKIVEQRLEAFGGKEKEAFREPLWLNEEKGIRIERVRCATGLSAVEPVRFDDAGRPIGFVKPGNNHHVAVYRDAAGGLHEHIVTFWHAVQRKRYGVPVVIENTDIVEEMREKGTDWPETFLEKLPDPGWELVLSLQQNEMFVLGMDDEAFETAMERKDYASLGACLYRVQKIASRNYVFRLHIETRVDDKYEGTKNEALSLRMGRMKQIYSFKALFDLHPRKVRIDVLGRIVKAKEDD